MQRQKPRSHEERARGAGAVSAPSASALLLCRPGFERDAALEAANLLGRGALAGTNAAASGDSGVVELARWDDGLDDLVFGRLALARFARLDALDARDRIGPVSAALDERGARYADVVVETSDGDQGRALAGFARSFEAALMQALKRARRIAPDAPERLHVFAHSATDLSLCARPVAALYAGRGGIPRLKLPRDAPSRSLLKLEEALLTLIDERARARLLKAGMRAVDLGAAPGGWTMALAARGLVVTAVDNGPLAPTVLAEPRVTHVRADGFRYRPHAPVDWLVCDMVEQPARVARLIGDWLESGSARNALFNLKLPMKKRHEAVVECLAPLAERLDAALPTGLGGPKATRARLRFALRARQLYHDRDEITVVLLAMG